MLKKSCLYCMLFLFVMGTIGAEEVKDTGYEVFLQSKIDYKDLTKKGKHIYDSHKSRKDTASLSIINVNPNLFTELDGKESIKLTFDLVEQKKSYTVVCKIEKSISKRTKKVKYFLTGDIPGLIFGDIIFFVREGYMTGNLNDGQHIYSLWGLQKNLYLLVQTDPSKSPGCATCEEALKENKKK